MAISQTMSNPNDPWSMQMYQSNFSNVPQTEPPPTTTTTPTNPGPSRNNSLSLSPDQGRVSKPIRRRSRASRRTPTTLLNTDATNFRAMVQQFTGGPSARPHQLQGGATAFNFSANSAMAAPQPTGFQMIYPNMQQQQQQMFMMNRMHGGAEGQPGSSSASGNGNYDNFML